MIRGIASVAVVSLVLGLLLSACSETTKYRMLNFFLDGVPVPGQVEVGPGQEFRPDRADQVADHRLDFGPRIQQFPHTPYRENRCGGCHDIQSGGLVRGLDEGLCILCHRDIPGDVRFVHGPVAVNDCSMCHHYHASPHPKLLLLDSRATCLQCHDRGDLTEGTHHAELDTVTCDSCHHPHGGNDRYFLKRASP